jgi:hypothetical protein
MFEEEFDKLSHGDQVQFRKVLSDLLYRCYVVRRIYDRGTKMNKISSDYLFIERHFDLLSDYLSFAGMELSKDDENGVCFLTSEDETNRIRIDGITTLIVYALRSYYEDKIKANPAVNEIYLDSIGLKVLLKDLGLTTVSRRISASTIASSLRTLSMYQIVVIAKGSFSEQSYAFYILPSIRYVISNAKLNALYAAIKSINEGGDNPSEDPSLLFSEQSSSGEEASAPTVEGTVDSADVQPAGQEESKPEDNADPQGGEENN